MHDTLQHGVALLENYTAILSIGFTVYGYPVGVRSIRETPSSKWYCTGSSTPVVVATRTICRLYVRSWHCTSHVLVGT